MSNVSKALELFQRGACANCARPNAGNGWWCEPCLALMPPVMAQVLALTPPGATSVECVKPRKERDWWTYVIGPATGSIKIGRSATVFSRRNDLQTSSSERLVVIAAIRGDHEAEAHQVADRWRVRGEWFKRACLPHVESLFVRLERAKFAA